MERANAANCTAMSWLWVAARGAPHLRKPGPGEAGGAARDGCDQRRTTSARSDAADWCRSRTAKFGLCRAAVSICESLRSVSEDMLGPLCLKSPEMDNFL